MESDGTLIINIGALVSGTALTARIATENEKPLMVVQLDREYRIDTVIQWLNENQIRVLNIAGPRESKRPGVYEKARKSICELLVGAGYTGE